MHTLAQLPFFLHFNDDYMVLALKLSLCLFLWTNLTLIMFVFLLCVLHLFSLFCVYLCKCFHLRSQLWKEAIAKEKNPWLMLITSPHSQRGLGHQQEFMILTSSYPLLHFKTMRGILKSLCCWLKGLLTRHLFLTQKIPKWFATKDWNYLLTNLDDAYENMVKEFYANAIYEGDELKC